MSLLVAICACSTGKHDARLDMVDRLAAESPRSALDSLAAIERDILSEADSHYYDLLTIKCADKAYITHTSDSLILNVIDWYAEHKSGHLYPEALYYGGRVYSDLGDYPTALKYFQDALDEVEDNDNKELYNRILVRPVACSSVLVFTMRLSLICKSAWKQVLRWERKMSHLMIINC